MDELQASQARFQVVTLKRQANSRVRGRVAMTGEGCLLGSPELVDYWDSECRGYECRVLRASERRDEEHSKGLDEQNGG